MKMATIAAKLRRAATRGEQARLTAEEVRAFLASPIYISLAEIERQELAETWVPKLPKAEKRSSAASGCGQEQSAAASGTSANMIPPAVARAELQLASQAALKMIRRSRLKPN